MLNRTSLFYLKRIIIYGRRSAVWRAFIHTDHGWVDGWEWERFDGVSCLDDRVAGWDSIEGSSWADHQSSFKRCLRGYAGRERESAGLGSLSVKLRDFENLVFLFRYLRYWSNKLNEIANCFFRNSKNFSERPPVTGSRWRIEEFSPLNCIVRAHPRAKNWSVVGLGIETRWRCRHKDSFL